MPSPSQPLRQRGGRLSPKTRLWSNLVAATTVALLPVALLPGASAHSFVSSITINGLAYEGFFPNPQSAATTADKQVGWSTKAFDQGYVNQTGFSSSPSSLSSIDPANSNDDGGLEITCHRGSASTPYHAPVEAGGAIHVQWNGWPQSHKGPVLSYLAFCGDYNGTAAGGLAETSGGGGGGDNSTFPIRGCEAVPKSELEFFKIEEAGLIIPGGDGTGTGTGKETSSSSPPPPAAPTNLAEMQWASDQLIANNNSWVIAIPERLRPGFYVLRHEIIALHNASQPVGAQAYPQCLNLLVTRAAGSGAGAGVGVAAGEEYVLPRGVRGRDLYETKGRDEGSFALDIYAPFGAGNATNKAVEKSYRIPGPPVAVAGRKVELSHPAPTGPGTPVIAELIL
ncbi:lytic cellulose monooxygenase (C1-hydroxylating) [Microdochium nivale]|nr:lytic cellulose monooxygenase (C1-hydroxylating) [Microdochium nivale]